MSQAQQGAYTAAGVDTERVQAGLARLTARLRATWPPPGGFGQVKLPFGDYANVVDVGGQGVAITTDSVGTKVLIAQMLRKYDTIGIDAVAINVNDLLCVGARPLALVDFISVQEAQPDLIEALGEGLVVGAQRAGVSIVGGEIAQVRDLMADPGYHPGYAFDLAATAIGAVDLDRIIAGDDLQAGDVIVGIESSGIHANGMSLAREVFFKRRRLDPEGLLPGTQLVLGEELLRPTHIYVAEVLDLLAQGVEAHGLAHISGDGLLNLPRLHAPVGFVIEQLPEPPLLFRVLQELGEVPAEEMFLVFNMGIGFCVIVPEGSAAQVVETVARHGKRAQVIGYVIPDARKRVHIRPFGLVGEGKTFQKSAA